MINFVFVFFVHIHDNGSCALRGSREVLFLFHVVTSSREKMLDDDPPVQSNASSEDGRMSR